MSDFKIIGDSHGQKILMTSIYDKPLLTIPQLNKGTAFTEKERLKKVTIEKKLPILSWVYQINRESYLYYIFRHIM